MFPILPAKQRRQHRTNKPEHWAQMRDRLQRIALPLGVGWPILFAAMTVVVFWAAGFPHGGPLPGPSRWPPVLPKFPLTHLWFLYVLLEFYAALLVLRAGVAWLDQDGRFLGRLKSTGIRPKFSERLNDWGITLESELFTLEPFARRVVGIR